MSVAAREMRGAPAEPRLSGRARRRLLNDYDESKGIEIEGCPPVELDPERSEPLTTTQSCPICRRALPADAGDPATADNLRDFLRRSHRADPGRYHAVLRRNPINQNVERNERSHELLTDFNEMAVGDTNESDDNPDHSDRNQPILRQVNRRTHRDWLSQQFR